MMIVPRDNVLVRAKDEQLMRKLVAKIAELRQNRDMEHAPHKLRQINITLYRLEQRYELLKKKHIKLVFSADRVPA